MGVRTNSFRAAGRSSATADPPAISDDAFVYEIRVTLSTEILMFSGLATTLLARATR
jgi:hypothetical protein